MPDHAEVHRAANRSSRKRHLRIWPQRDRQALTKKFHLQRQASNRIKVTFDSFTRGVASPRVGSGSRILCRASADSLQAVCVKRRALMHYQRKTPPSADQARLRWSAEIPLPVKMRLDVEPFRGEPIDRKPAALLIHPSPHRRHHPDRRHRVRPCSLCRIAVRLWASHFAVIGRTVHARRSASYRGLPSFRLDR